MVQDVADHKHDCIDDANEIRWSIVEGVQELRASFELQLSTMRATDSATLTATQKAGSDAIDQAADDAAAAIRAEADARLSGTAAVDIERQRIEGEIKKVYYEAQDPYDPEQMKYDIKALVKEFEDWVASQSASWDSIVDATRDALESVIYTEASRLSDQTLNALNAW